MANEDNNINELVSDDDPTIELETLGFEQETADNKELESDTGTFDTQDVASAETISRLQFDIEQLRSRWLGLESEIKAREAQTTQLQDAVGRKDKLITKRDRKIKLLKTEIRQRDEKHRSLIRHYDELQQSLDTDKNEAADEQDTNYTLADFKRRLAQSENYADSLRWQTQDLLESSSQSGKEIDQLSQSVLDTAQSNTELTEELRRAAAGADELQRKLDTIEQEHAREIRLLRFELGEAQSTVIETEDLNSKLSSDLIDAQGFKDEMEQMLNDADDQATRSIESLQKQVRKLARTADTYEQKLVSKGQAISVLLAELAKQSDQIDVIGEIDDVIHDIGTRMTERDASNGEPNRRAAVDRVTRVLVGTVDRQVLRFPLFKDKMTIGRTADNDIQLKAAYISRRHAVVQTDGDTTRIIDWGSRNGVFVNSDKITEHFLHHGDIVVIGDARFRYEERKKRNS